MAISQAIPTDFGTGLAILESIQSASDRISESISDQYLDFLRRSPRVPDHENERFLSNRFSETAEEPLEEFFIGAPEAILERVSYGTGILSLRAAPEVREIFVRYVASHATERKNFIRQLEKAGTPDSILDVALDEFREKGNEKRLIKAADLLRRFGRAAIQPLERLGRAGAAECEYFLDLLADLAEDESLAEPLEDLLSTWSRHPLREIREQLLDVNDAFPAPVRNMLLQRLAKDIDETIAERAIDLLEAERGPY